LNQAADQYVAFYDNEPVAICAVLHHPHGIVKNMKRISRIVTRPDYQGVGIGTRLLQAVAQHYVSNGYRMTITTTTPALIHSFQRDDHWRLTRQGRSAARSKRSKIERNKMIIGSDSGNRITTAWEYKNINSV
jgi:GNAT superfamily N-acetyltransferase